MRSAARLIVAFGVVAIVAVFVLATALLDARAGAAAAVLLVLSSGFTRHAALIFVDVPGMAIPMVAIAATYLLWRGGRLHPAAYVVVPLLAMAAAYIRYGAPATLAPGMAAIVVVLAFQQWRRRAKAFVLEVIGLAGAVGVAVGLVLMVPWFTAQPVSPLRSQQAFRDAKGIPMLDSVDDLLAITWPNGETQDFFHPLVFLAIVVLVASAVVGYVTTLRIRPAVVFGALGGVSTVVLMNVNLSLIAAQYLVLAIPYLVILAGAGFTVLVDLVSRADVTVRAVAATGVAICALYATVALHQRVQDAATTLNTQFSAVRDAGFAVRSFGADDCVVLTGTAPQVGWYAQCRMATWGSATVEESFDQAVRDRVELHDQPMTVYVVDVLRGKREPGSDVFDANLDSLTALAEVGTPDDGPRQYIRVFQLQPCVLTDSCAPR